MYVCMYPPLATRILHFVMKFNKQETERFILNWEKMTHGDEKGRVSKTDRCIRMSEGQWISLSSVCSRILGSQNNLLYYLISIKLTNQNEECFFLFFIQTAQSRLKNMKAQKNWVRSFFKFWRLFWNLLIIHVVKSQ